MRWQKTFISLLNRQLILVIVAVCFHSKLTHANDWTVRGNFFEQNALQEKRARDWFYFYTGRARRTFVAHLEKGTAYRALVENVLASYGLPRELYYLGLIESGYDTKATSKVGARGPWQFMEGTAIKYGLKIVSHKTNKNLKLLDERLSVPKSTHAAANYLLDLYNIFYDWALAAAAYNSGEYKVLDAVRKGNSRNMRELCDRKLLAQETCDFVAKIWVAKELDLRREEFKLPPEQPQKYYDWYWTEITIKRSTDIEAVAKNLNIPKSELEQFNPDILTETIQGSEAESWKLYVPNNHFKSSMNRYMASGGKALRVKNPKFLRQIGLEILEGESVWVKKMANKSLELVAPLSANRMVIGAEKLADLKIDWEK